MSVARVDDEDAKALVVGVIEQAIKRAVPRVRYKRADAVVDVGAFVVLLELLNVFASLHVALVRPASARDTPRPHVAVLSKCLAGFPRPKYIDERIAEDAGRGDATIERNLLTPGEPVKRNFAGGHGIAEAGCAPSAARGPRGRTRSTFTETAVVDIGG